jgi:hypothetical protein
MGNGLTPGPANDLGDPIVIDDGTLARTESPPPGAIGLDADSGSPNQTQGNIADQIVGYSQRRLRRKVGDGECFTLADRALKNAGAKSAEDYGKITTTADYVWGTEQKLADVKPGDIVQLRDYRFDRRIDTRRPDGSSSWKTDFKERPHHTAVVESVDGNGAITVLEQNAPPGSPVVRNQLFFSGSTTSSGNTTTTIKVQGTWWFYRPQTR